MQILILLSPFHVEADPDPTVNIDADPACHSHADLNPAPVVNFQCLNIVGKTCVKTMVVDQHLVPNPGF